MTVNKMKNIVETNIIAKTLILIYYSSYMLDEVIRSQAMNNRGLD